MVVLFSNCRRRDHAAIYGDGAFYDLDANRRLGHRVPSLAPGTPCVVATPVDDGRVAFAWFHFLREEILPDENTVPGRVFFGPCVGSQALSREEATNAAPYCEFFNGRGHFRQRSAICLPLVSEKVQQARWVRSERTRLREAVRLAYVDGEPDGPRSYAALAWAVKGIASG